MGHEHDEKNNEGGEKAEVGADNRAKTPKIEENADGKPEGKIHRSASESSICATEDEEDDEGHKKIELGPQYTLKEQFEKDKVCLFFP